MTIAVYCSAKDSIPEEYLRLGDELGTWIASHGYTLLYGGATGGLMSRVSNAAHAHGGRIIGVVPQRVIEVGRKADNCSEIHCVATMNERKQMMKALSDCFICLPGSYGTLDEMYDVIASGTVGEHHKPVFILNYKGFYDGLLAEAQHMRELGFLPPVDGFAPIFVPNLEELCSHIEQITK